MNDTLRNYIVNVLGLLPSGLDVQQALSGDHDNYLAGYYDMYIESQVAQHGLRDDMPSGLSRLARIRSGSPTE